MCVGGALYVFCVNQFFLIYSYASSCAQVLLAYGWACGRGLFACMRPCLGIYS